MQITNLCIQELFVERYYLLYLFLIFLAMLQEHMFDAL